MRLLINDIESNLKFECSTSSYYSEPLNASQLSEALLTKDNPEYTILPYGKPGSIEFIITSNYNYNERIHNSNKYLRIMKDIFNVFRGYNVGKGVIIQNRGLFLPKFKSNIINDEECSPKDTQTFKLKMYPKLQELSLLFQLGFKKSNELVQDVENSFNYNIHEHFVHYWKNKIPNFGRYRLDLGDNKLLEPYSPVLFVDFSIFVQDYEVDINFETLYRKLLHVCERQGIEVIIVDNLISMFYEHVPRNMENLKKYFINPILDTFHQE